MISETQTLRIYLDQRVALTDDVAELVSSIEKASESKLSTVIETLIGPVADIDADGRLAVVLTPDVELLGTIAAPVKGLTRSSDFARGLDRPASNQADVVFLTPNICPGDELKTVLAHEWCHAAVFSRRLVATRLYKHRPSEDDWLNEAIAHVVEVRATGSWSNLQHRVRAFATHPETSPLVVRDYFHSEYWRHDGCRGAAFLFLQWCAKEAGDSVIERLLESSDCTTEALEVVMGCSFAELFRGWTMSLGQAVADRASGHEKENESQVVETERWQLEPSKVQSRTIRIRGAASAYVLVECDASNDWELKITAPKPAQVQASLVQTPATTSASRP